MIFSELINLANMRINVRKIAISFGVLALGTKLVIDGNKFISHRRQSREKGYLPYDPEFTGFRLVKVIFDPHFSEKDYCLLPTELVQTMNESMHILNRFLSKNDVIIASYPKSGTTWLSEIVHLLLYRLDFNKAMSANLEERVPYVEYLWPGPSKIVEKPVPRLLKTHLPFDLLPDEVKFGNSCKIIYIIRDPRDVVVSYYHFCRNLIPAGFKNKEGIEGFQKRFINDLLPYSPWSTHVKSFTRVAASPKNSDRVLLVHYEDLSRDLIGQLRRIDKFLNPKLAPLSEDELKAVAKHCSFEEMSKNPNTNFKWWIEMGFWRAPSKSNPDGNFLRKGEVGDHRQKITEEMRTNIEVLARDNDLQWTLKK